MPCSVNLRCTVGEGRAVAVRRGASQDIGCKRAVLFCTDCGTVQAPACVRAIPDQYHRISLELATIRPYHHQLLSGQITTSNQTTSQPIQSQPTSQQTRTSADLCQVEKRHDETLEPSLIVRPGLIKHPEDSSVKWTGFCS